MRTTLSTMYTKIEGNLGRITTEMSQINERISTGKQMSRISDKPVNLVSALRFRSSIVELDQYSENITYGGNLITASEAALTQIKDMTARAKTLAIQATDPALTVENRAAIAEEIKNIFNQSVQLANTQINGKYIFGGYRTTGYTDEEPAPFIADKGDGHWVNGTAFSTLSGILTSSTIEAAATTTDLVAGDLLINGEDIGAVDLTTVADEDGINMAGANNLKTAINLKTTLYSNVAATGDPAGGTGSAFQFDLNGTTISITIADGLSATNVANATIAAITAETATTGVTAFIGDGTNGGPVDSVVFQNSQASDNTTITATNFTTVTNGGAALGFGNFTEPITTATLTTQTSGATAAAAAGGEVIDYTINGVRIYHTLTAGTPTQTAQQSVDAINLVSAQTGVSAVLGIGTNGGPANSVILQNSITGNESDIIINGIAAGAPNNEDLNTGFTDGTYSVGAANNTGQISFTSGATTAITTSSTASDVILTRLGLGGGSVGFADNASDGSLTYGSRINSTDLLINGTAVPAPSADGLSDVYADASAAAKATAINTLTTTTGVTAEIIPVQLTTQQAVEAGTEATRLTGTVTNTEILAGSLAINGTVLNSQISSANAAQLAASNGLNMTKAYNARQEINTISNTTNVTARLTYLLAGNAATAPGAGSVAFTLNGQTVSLSTGGVSAAESAKDVVSAINALTSTTGVEAKVGDGTNGGATNEVVLSNKVKGNENRIVLAGIDAGETAITGLSDSNLAIDATRNTGEISFESTSPITITSPTTSPAADTVINELGLSSTTALGLGVGSTLTATMSGVAIVAGDLAINGVPIAGAISSGGATDGIFMDQAFAAKTQIETADSNVTVNLTTMTDSGVATVAASAATTTDISFNLNGEQIQVTYPTGATVNNVTQATISAINLKSTQTGVTAVVGDGTNGGLANTIVFTNSTIGDATAITVTDFTVNSGNNDLGFANFTQAADATNNSGQLTITSTTTFELSSPTTAPKTDAILNQLGLGGGGKGYSDVAGDGIIYGSNGTGSGQVTSGATPGYLDSGDVIINGIDLFSSPTAILENDSTYALVDAINAKTSQTGIQATRGLDGKLLLSASDGRNLHIETTAHGESITHLNNGSNDQIFFGSLQLKSDRKFTLQTTLGSAPNLYEPGLAAIGLAGGSTITGEPTDTASDGKIDVFSIHDQIGTVRYAGDRINDLSIKTGKSSTMTVGENGKTVLADSNIFTTLKSLEDYLLGKKFSSVTGVHKASDTSKTLNSKLTGLEPASQLPTENLFTDGSFTITVTDNDFSPARTSALTIEVNTATDTLGSVAKHIDGMPNVSASWTADGYLKIESIDPSRYTIDLGFDSSNFLAATGVSFEFMQHNALQQSLDNLDAMTGNITEQISDFGARANRITIQTQIYSNMTISTKENLSEVQDTDMIEAVMDLKSKEVAYQAALSAASKAMRLSLVDFL